MKSAVMSILLSGLLAAAGQNVKVKVRAALYDRDLNLKPVPHLTIKLVPAGSEAQPITIQTNFDGIAEAELPSGKYRVVTDSPIELFDKAYRWELDADLSRPDNTLELSNDNAKATPLAAGRDAHVDELAYHFKRVKDAVVTVWTEQASFDGFVVDPAGLVLTVQGPLEGAAWMAVQLDDRRRLPAVLAASDKQHDVAVIRINPSAVGQITSVQLSTDPDALVEGERVFTIENPGKEKDKKLVTGVLSKADLQELVSDVKTSDVGGPLFNSSGSAVGLIQRSGENFRIRPIALATETLAEAKQQLASSPAPPSRLLPSIPTDQFPAESLSDLGRNRWEKDVYSLKLGDFDIEFVTPVARYETDSERYEQQMRAYNRSKGRMSPPAQPEHKYDAVLLIYALPKTKMPFWENMAQSMGTYNRGPTILRYKTGFLRMQLLCGEKEIEPILPGRGVVGGGESPYVVVPEESSAGRYLYANDAVSPQCGKVTLQVFSTKDPEHPVAKDLDEKVVTRLWQDFEPYRKLQAPPSSVAAPQ